MKVRFYQDILPILNFSKLSILHETEVRTQWDHEHTICQK